MQFKLEPWSACEFSGVEQFMKMKQVYAVVIGDEDMGNGSRPRVGGIIRTRATTEKGIAKAAVRQLWAGCPASLCGYRAVYVEIDVRRTLAIDL